MKNLKRNPAFALAFILIFILSACGGSFEYNKDEAIKNAQKLIETVNTKDYTAAADMLPENLKSQITAETLQNAWDPLLSDAGSFIDYESCTTTGVTKDDMNYILVVVPCEYENNTLTFTVTYTEDYKIVALEMK